MCYIELSQTAKEYARDMYGQDQAIEEYLVEHPDMVGASEDADVGDIFDACGYVFNEDGTRDGKELKTYRIRYEFNGSGHCLVRAANAYDAKSRFFNGDFEDENETGEEYAINSIESLG
ncbi:MAG: hypothetical protein WC477_07350 [Patescibacteria group bacterium]